MQPSPQHRVSISETWVKLYKQGWRSLLGIAVLAIAPLLFAQSTVDTPSNVAEQFLLAAANRDRVARGLKPLRNDPILARAALAHAREMAAHRGISHRFPGELQLSARGATAGARFSLITENVAQAPISTMIHDLWMGSQGHRENILDPNVDTVGIAVVVRDHEYYAVEDFANNVMPLTVDAQETAVSDLVAKSGMKIANGTVMSEQDARQTCSMNSGYAGSSTPWYIMRYTAHDVTELPAQLLSRLNSGRYRKAVVSACSEKTTGPFTAYNIAVLLYP